MPLDPMSDKAPEPPSQTTVVGLGEALFDCFPDRTVLGGAPINLAVHAHALLAPSGGVGVPATRVGDDPLGVRYQQELHQRGLSSSAIQVDPKHPTGTVTVELTSDKNAQYTFAADTAWDHLALTPAWQSLAKQCNAVAYGTLAQRSSCSRTAVRGFVEQASNAVRLFDVNLRGDFYSAEIVEVSLRLATAVKLNEEELPLVATMLGANSAADASPDNQAKWLCETFALDWLALTRGAKGTVLFSLGDRHEESGATHSFDPMPNADSVGAGDACAAGLLVGSLLDLPPAKTLALANRIGAFVASQPGATPQLPDTVLAMASR